MADSNPADGNGRTFLKARAQMDGPVDPDFGSSPNSRPMEYGGSRGDEYLIAYLGADHMAVRTDETVVPYRAGMTTRRTYDRVLQHNAIVTDVDRPAIFRDDTGSVHYPAPRADRHITANCCIRRYPCVGVDFRLVLSITNNHRVPPCCSIASARLPIGQTSGPQRSCSHRRQVVRARARDVVAPARIWSKHGFELSAFFRRQS